MLTRLPGWRDRWASAFRSLMQACTVAMLMATTARSQGTTAIPDALREIVHYNAPFIIGENDAPPPPDGSASYVNTFHVDQVVRVDFDGNTLGIDNVSHAETDPPAGDHTATVYYSVDENGQTSDIGYYFIGYYWYHVKDGGAEVDWFHFGTHDHDLEGTFLIVKKSPYLPYGAVVGATTEAHGALIPYIPHSSIVDDYVADGAFGYIEFWGDWRYGYIWNRPIIAIAKSTHGSYMAQNCNPAYGPELDHGFGAYLGVESTQGYIPCIRQGAGVILYVPEMAEALSPGSGLPQPDQPTWNFTQGTATYQLIEVYQSPMWSLRTAFEQLFAGGQITTSQFSGLVDFYPANGANPMWQWQGGTGECQVGNCWYSFAVDGTNGFYSPVHWPISANYAQLLINPAGEASQRFPNLPELSYPYRYNPYVPSPPNYYGPAPLSVGISGPGYLDAGDAGTWEAEATGGTPPYTFAWSGIAVGSGESLTASPTDSGYLYIEAWDSAGQQSMSSVYVNIGVSCPGGGTLCS